MRTLPLAFLFLSLANGEGVLSPAERQRNLESFEHVWKTVRDKHWDPKLNGLDWQAVRDEFRPQIEKADSMAKARDAMSEMLGRLKQSHLDIIPAEAFAQIESGPGSREGSPGLDVRLIDGQVLVSSVAEGSPAAAAGIRPGWEIVAIDGRDLGPALGLIRKDFEKSTWLEAIARGATRNRLAGEPGSVVRLGLRNGQNQTVEVAVPRVRPRGVRAQIGFLPPVHVWAESRRLAEGIGYFTFNLFLDPENVMKTAAEAITSSLEGKGLIMDLRGNSGGLGAMVMGLAGWFVEEKGLWLGTMHTRETSLRLVVNPRPVTYRGPLAVLVDGCSVCASECLAGGLKDLKRARVFGSRTTGMALPSAVEKLPNGDGFLFAFGNYVARGGQPLEGVGVMPDVEVKLTREALLEGRDPILEAAVHWITARPAANKRKSKGKRQKSKGKNLCAGPRAGLGRDLQGLTAIKTIVNDSILERRRKLATSRNPRGAQRGGTLVVQNTLRAKTKGKGKDSSL